MSVGAGDVPGAELGDARGIDPLIRRRGRVLTFQCREIARSL